MATSHLSVGWKDHSSTLATVCKDLLDDNVLLDCTIAAEGQSLKAHKLILSACSPYFRMLFSQENGKHPFVVLLDASFETLKAVIDFVYSGETRIPERNLKAFLALAKSLQIKGLNNSSLKDGNKNLSGNADGNVTPCPSSGNHDYCKVHGTTASHSDSLENSSPEHFHHSGGYTDAVQSNSSVLLAGSSTSCEEVRSVPVMTPPQEPQLLPVCDVPSIDTEITVKHEPNYSVSSEVEVVAAPKFNEQNLNQYSSCSESEGNVESAAVMPLQKQKKRITQLPHEASSAPDLAEPQSMLPVILVVKSEEMDASEGEDHIHDHDMPENEANEMDQGANPALGEKDVNQCSTVLENRSVLTNLGKGEAAEVEARKIRYAAAASLGASPSQMYRCGVCGGYFRWRIKLLLHMRTHSKERPYGCNVCGDTFARAESLGEHMKRHPRKRPHLCDLCGKSFYQKSHLHEHMRVHTGERPYRCDMCCIAFTTSSTLKHHRRRHTGERPYRCGVCGDAFSAARTLRLHTLRHTGERPFRCNVCDRSFLQDNHLRSHMCAHTGERRLCCHVCGDTFAQTKSLSAHLLKHASERP